MRSAHWMLRGVAAGLAAVVLTSLSEPEARAAGPPGVLCVIDAVLGSPLGTDCDEPSRPTGSTPPDGTSTAAGSTAAPAARARRDVVPDVIVVKFRLNVREAQIDELLDRQDLATLRTIPALRTRAVRVVPTRRAQTIAELARSPIVARAEEDLVVRSTDVTPNDSAWANQWGAQLVRAPRAWEVTRGRPTVLVAVLDTGVDSGQADLRGAFTGGFDVIDGDADPVDQHGHGTAVAGVIGARTNNREGQAGLCWSCTLLPIRVLGSDGSGTTSTVAAGIVRAVDAGARVINLSLGSDATTETLDESVAYAIRHDRLLVAAAGNDGRPSAIYPAAHPGVISVAATNRNDRLYPWSNHGAGVRFAAPGCNTAPMLTGGYGDFCGTSAAAPVVSGIAALAISANPAVTGTQVADALRRSVVPVAGVEFGRVDAARTLEAVLPPPARFTAEGRARPGVVRTYSLTVGSGPFEAIVRSDERRVSLRLELRTPAGARVAVAAGRGTLRLRHVVASGAYVLRLRAAAPTTYALAISYASPPT